MGCFGLRVSWGPGCYSLGVGCNMVGASNLGHLCWHERGAPSSADHRSCEQSREMHFSIGIVQIEASMHMSMCTSCFLATVWVPMKPSVERPVGRRWPRLFVTRWAQLARRLLVRRLVSSARVILYEHWLLNRRFWPSLLRKWERIVQAALALVYIPLSNLRLVRWAVTWWGFEMFLPGGNLGSRVLQPGVKL